MRVVTDAGMILKQLGVLTKLAPSDSGNVSLEVGKNLKLYSLNGLANFQSIVPCDQIEGEAEFSVNIESLKTLLRNRGKVELQYVNTMLVISEKGYKAELVTTDPVESQSYKNLSNDKIQGKVWKISADQGQWLQKACKKVQLRVVEALSPFMPLTVNVTSKGAFLACYDNNHMAFLRDKETTGDIDFTMPAETLISVLDSFLKSSYVIEVGDQVMEILSKLLKVRMNLPNADSYLPVGELINLANKTLKQEKQFIKVDCDRLVNFMDSCSAVATKERSELKIKANGKKLLLSVKTIAGNVNQTLPLEQPCSCEFSLDFLYLQEAIQKAKAEFIEIGVIKDSSVIVGANNAHTIISVFD